VVLDVLSRYTRTPGDCYFCLWDGWGQQVHKSDGARTLEVRTDAIGAEPGIDPFSPSVLHEPMVVVPNRAYFLFRGP